MKDSDNYLVINRRITFIMIITILLFLVIIFRVSYLQMFNVKASVNELNKLSTKTVYGDSMPRGRIYDRNYNIIVDNIGTNKISYKRPSGFKTENEIKLARTLAEKLEINYGKLTKKNLKKF